MSRIGRKPIKIPEGVKVVVGKDKITASGPKGELVVDLYSRLKVEQSNGVVVVTREGESKKVRSLHGLLRSLIANAVAGVSEGFSKELEMVGVGYRAKLEGRQLVLTVGFSHPVKITPPPGIEFAVEKNTKITISGIDKQLVGETAAKVRKVRPPEPYKGKGIRYKGEVVRKKPGKAAKTVGIGG